MGLFATSASAVQRPGVFPIEVAPPTVIDGVISGYCAHAFVGEWGPVQTGYVPSSGGDMINNYFPAGSTHTSTGYYSVMRRKAVPWAMCRVLGGAAGIYSVALPTFIVTGTPGTTSNTYVCVAKNASGASVGSPALVIATCNATLSSSNFPTITPAAVTGATSYDIYRTVSGGTPSSVGIIGNTNGAALQDKALAGDSTTPPVLNTTGWTPATCNINNAAGQTVAILVAKWPGTLGNSIVPAIAAATDGNANHFNLTLTLTNPTTGTTTETYPNLSVQATQILPVVTSSLLLASFTVLGTPVTNPSVGTLAMIGGSNGAAVAATDYNTALTAIGLLPTILTQTIDDCGDTIRAATNANVQTAADAKTDRICILQGSDANTLAQAITDVGSYRDDRVIYAGQWVTVLDDTGTPQMSPFATFIASAIANTEPQQSHAWWDPRVTTYYNGIASLRSTQFSSADEGNQNSCTQQGICLPIKLDSGSFAALHDRTTNVTVVGKRFAVTRRIKDYLAKALRNALVTYVNGPNTLNRWREIKIATDDFLGREVSKGRIAAGVGSSIAFLSDIKTGNTSSSQAAGQFYLTISGTTPAPMEDLFINLNVGPTVVVTIA